MLGKVVVKRGVRGEAKSFGRNSMCRHIAGARPPRKTVSGRFADGSLCVNELQQAINEGALARHDLFARYFGREPAGSIDLRKGGFAAALRRPFDLEGI